MRRLAVTDAAVAATLTMAVAVARAGFVLCVYAVMMWPNHWPFLAADTAMLAGAKLLRRAARTPGEPHTHKCRNSTEKYVPAVPTVSVDPLFCDPPTSR